MYRSARSLRFSPTAIGAALLLSSIGCKPVVVPKLGLLPERAPASAYDLSPVGDCDTRIRPAREAAIRAAKKWMEERRKVHEGICDGSLPWSEAEPRFPLYGPHKYYRSYGGEEDGYGYEFADDPLSAGGGGVAAAARGAQNHAVRGFGSFAANASRTNVQVRGVDEADILKNDNKYAYVVHDSALKIVQAWPPERARVIGTLAVDGEPLSLFVTPSKAVVFSTVSGEHAARTQAAIVDLTDRSNPRLDRLLDLPGELIAARRIGTAIHAVVTQTRYPVLERIGRWRLPPKLCGGTYFEMYEDRSDRMVELIRSQPDLAWLPHVKLSRGANGPSQTLAGCNQYGRASEERDANTSIVSFDLHGGPPSIVSIFDAPTVVYASAKTIYLASLDRRGLLEDLRQHHPSTNDEVNKVTAIHRFRLDGATAHYAGTGLVPGELINQFAMDEYEGKLRVATHTAAATSISSTVAVLVDSAGSMVIGGWVGGIAPGERMRSVRFVGDRGYLVTFRQVDPLFAFDLRQAKPILLGELKIPGYATYIHPLAPDQLLTVGFGSSNPKRPERNDSVRLQLVDVNNPHQPRLAHVEIIGPRGSKSEAQESHLAFNYFAPRELLLLPIEVTRTAGKQPGLHGFTGLLAYTASMKAGFRQLGRIDSSKVGKVRRTAVLDDYVLSLTGSYLSLHRLDELGKSVAEVSLGSEKRGKSK